MAAERLSWHLWRFGPHGVYAAFAWLYMPQEMGCGEPVEQLEATGCSTILIPESSRPKPDIALRNMRSPAKFAIRPLTAPLAATSFFPAKRA